MRNAFLAPLPLVLATACVQPELLKALEAPSDDAPVVSAEPSVAANVDVANEDSEQAARAHPAPASRAANADHPLPDPVSFRIGAGYGVLGRVELEPCRDKGLAPGYLRMRVTFRRTGTVARAKIESAVPPPAEALTCIGERLAVMRVPAFDGGDVTLSRSYFVVPDSRAPAFLVLR